VQGQARDQSKREPDARGRAQPVTRIFPRGLFPAQRADHAGARGDWHLDAAEGAEDKAAAVVMRGEAITSGSRE